MQNLRLKTSKIIQTILEEKIFFGELKSDISEKDLPFVNMLVLTSLRHWRQSKCILQSLLTKKIPNKHRFAEYLILTAMAEILYMNTPVYAVINETVNNIRKTTDMFLSKMANAVLRKIADNKEYYLAEAAKISPIPADFIMLLEGYSREEKKNIEASINKIPALDISVKNNPEMWAEKLNAMLLPNGSLRLLKSPKIHEIEGYNDGEWWVQDAASALPVQALGNIKGLKVVDLCAAPGGKTAQLAAMGAEVTALDISETRLDTLKQNMKRLKFENIKTIATDALDFLQNSEEKFDVILLDAPCSATGTYRRHPEVLHIKNKQDVEAQALLQRKLLEGCKNILKKNGILLYSVCSICKTEGELQIKRFLKDNPEFQIVPITPDLVEKFGKWDKPLITGDGIIRTICEENSEKNNLDSFFICKMKRII